MCLTLSFAIVLATVAAQETTSLVPKAPLDIRYPGLVKCDPIDARPGPNEPLRRRNLGGRRPKIKGFREINRFHSQMRVGGMMS